MAKELLYIADTLDGVMKELRARGCTKDMFEYIEDTIHAQHDRFGELKIGLALGYDADALLQHGETGEEMRAPALIWQMDLSTVAQPDVLVNRVMIGFLLVDDKIDQIIRMS